MPPMMPGMGMPGSMDDNAGGGSSASGQDAQRQALESAMGELRELKGQIDAFAGKYPALASEAKQLQQVFKRMVVKLAQAAPQQTASSERLPMGG